MSMDCITLLFVPADRPDRYAKAASSGADGIVIDLEDAVSPHAKISARGALCRPGALPEDATIFVRLNGRATPWHADDVAAISLLRIAGVVLPKAESSADIETLSAELNGLPIIALIETAHGLAAVRDIARARPAARLAFGSIDFCADMGISHMREALLCARSELVLASRINGLSPALDGVTTAIDDAALVEDDARYASQLGFGGKLCIHPRQIEPTRRGFIPSAAELAWARSVMAAGGEGAVSTDGAMVDAPVRERARQFLAREAARTSLDAN